MIDDGQDGFDLLSAVPAAELARLRRRVVFLEAALTQMLRDEGQLREWFSAAELAAMALPGLPRTRGGVAQVAKAQGWQRIVTTGRGGERQLYHFASLPRRAFEGLVDLVLRSEPPAALAAPETSLPAIELTATAPQPARNMAPAWVLPLLRDQVPLEAAMRRLPDCMPAAVACPSLGEAREMLRSLGLLGEVG